MSTSKSEHVLALATELLDDIELSRLPAEQLLLKSSRLARLAGSDEVKKWIGYEMNGYSGDNPICNKYMQLTGRWINRDERKGYWGPLLQQEAVIAAQNIKLQSMSMPDTSGGHGLMILKQHNENTKGIASTISTLTGIKSRVLGLLHAFITSVYYEKEFDNLAESIFERYKGEVDSLISNSCGDVLEQIPSVMSRLSENEHESISQALVTVRRIIESFADSIYPPTDIKINMSGNEVSLDASKHQNRINAFVHERIDSKSRKSKIRQNLSNLYDRVSTGVHKDVSIEEAKSLFLNTYLLLGEILHIGKLDKLAMQES